MSIDWITVSAQIINFLILVWLLKRFLYRPVIRAMDRREQRIADRLNDAESREQLANQAQHEYETKQRELEQQKNEILNHAKEDVEKQKRQWLDESREQVAETRQNWQAQAKQEKAEFLSNLRYQASTAIQTIARKALNDLADTELEEYIIQVFIERLKRLDKDTRESLADKKQPVQLVSTFKLNSSIRSHLTRVIHDNIAAAIEVNYTTSPDLLCGIELRCGEMRLSWNLAEYLESLEAQLEQAFAVTKRSDKEA
ncbi:MAG: F0F1 ATP synthase subunit B [Thioalkalispiraceae bacterium]|jgi:F-type H+-transporting ATPase subunit b